MDYYSIRLNKNSSDRVKTWIALSKYLSRYIPSNSTVLDIAAGECLFINNIVAGKKFAVDSDERLKFFADKNVQIKVCNALDLLSFKLLKKEGIDVVFSSNFLEHLSMIECQQLLRKIMQILNKGGLIILMQPNYRYCYKNYWDDFTHKTAFSHTSLVELLLSEGYKIKKCYRKFMPLTLNSSLASLSFLVPIYLRLPFKPMAGQMLIVAEKIN